MTQDASVSPLSHNFIYKRKGHLQVLWWGRPSSERRPPIPLPSEREPIGGLFKI
ncbi:hypothetical protein D3C76_05580 [compost metagenome]